jgi:hypothetical protein
MTTAMEELQELLLAREEELT